MTTPPPYGEPPRLTADAATWRAEDALRDKIAAALNRHRESYRDPATALSWDLLSDRARDLYTETADAVLPIVAAEVTAAVKAERVRIVEVLEGKATTRAVGMLLRGPDRDRPVRVAEIGRVLAALRDLIDSKGGAS